MGKTEINLLYKLHTSLIKFPITFRDQVCEECNWSIPTFYRKMRKRDKILELQKISALSNAEKEAIIRQAKAVCQEISDFIRKTCS